MIDKQLKILRTEKGLSQTALAKIFGVSQQAVAKWENGKSFPESQIIVKLAQYFGISTDLLLGVTDDIRANLPRVQVIGSVKAGYNMLADEVDLGSELADVNDPQEYRYLVVEGDSMEPHIYEGDLALVKIQPVLENGDLGVMIYNGEATLKRYRRQSWGIILEPFNPEYEKMYIRGQDLNDLYIFGKVVETKRRWD